MILSARAVVAALLAALCMSACMSSDVPGNANGSEPVNDDESGEYKKAIARCYKTGGTRIVKIMGELRCY